MDLLVFEVSRLGTWEFIRFFGLLAYFFFTLSIVFGMIQQMARKKTLKPLCFHIHMTSSWAGLFSVLVHMLLLLIDQYEPFAIPEILIPFLASYEPFLSGMGTLAFFLVLAVMITSDLVREKLKRSVWKKIHGLVFPAWLLMLAHGFFIGTDSANLFISLFYSLSFVIVPALFAYKKFASDVPANNNALPNRKTDG